MYTCGYLYTKQHQQTIAYRLCSWPERGNSALLSRRVHICVYSHNICSYIHQTSDDLFSVSGRAVVRSIRHFPRKERDAVQSTFGNASEQLLGTAFHALQIHGSSCCITKPILTSEVCGGHLVRTHAFHSLRTCFRAGGHVSCSA